jgi:hypothetical protein
LGLLKDTLVSSRPKAFCSGISILALVAPSSVLNLTVMPSFAPIMFMAPDQDVSVGDCAKEVNENKSKNSSNRSFGGFIELLN